MKKSCLILFLLISFSGYAQLTLRQKNMVALIKKPDKFLYAYYNSRSLEEKSNTISWVIEKMDDSQDPKELIILDMLKARLLKDQGRYIEAKNKLEDAIRFFEQSSIVIKSNDYTKIFDSYLSIYDELAEIYLNLGNLSKAREYYEQSLEIRTKGFKKKDIFRLGPLIGLAKINYYEGDWDLALLQFTECKESLLYTTQTMKIPSKYYSEIYLNSADILFKKKLYNEALRSAKIAEGQTHSSMGLDNLLRIEAQSLIAEIYITQGNLKNGLKWMDKAFELYNKYFTPELNEYSQLLKLKAKFIVAEGQSREEAYGAVLAMMQNHLNFLNNNFSALSEKEKTDFYDRVNEDLAYYFLIAFNTYDETKDVKILEAIIDLRMETKGFILNNQNKIKTSIMQSGDVELINGLSAWQNAKEHLAYELFEDPRGPKTDSLRVLINDMERVLSTKTQLISSNNNPTINDLRTSLAGKDVAVEIIRYGNEADDQINLAAIIISANDIKLVQKTTSEEEEIKSIKFYRNAVQYELQDTKSYSFFWSEIDNHLTNVNRVYCSPDGSYHQLNVNTLYRPKDDSYVLDSYQVINMTNLKDLLNKQNVTYELSVTLFGRPQYDYNSQVGNYSSIEEDEILRSSLFLELEGFQDQSFSDLPGTATEIKSISTTLNKYEWEVSEFTGPAATEHQVKLIGNTGILHIATHGFFLEGGSHINPMIKSGLVMAGVNNEGKTRDDGVLTAYEATNLKLDNTWLVVLSACETGLGDVKNGEGVYGLQRALTVAGAANLMMTLWKVDDAATKELMIDFYSQLGDNVPLEIAFRNSQLNLRKKYPNPKYWGAFILVKAKG